MKVLIVDDSVVFRSQIKNALTGITGIEVVGAAVNGKLAIEKLKAESVDLITLDMEMPELNGIETIKEMKRMGMKTRVIVFCSATEKGAEMALEALRLGAVDFIAKPKMESINIELARTEIQNQLVPKILQFVPRSERVEKTSSTRKINLHTFVPSAIVIGSSTGGPVALETLFEKVKWPTAFCPVFLVQHMPGGGFTTSLAERLARVAKVSVTEGKNWEVISKGKVYLAPGDYHMNVHKDGEQLRIKLDQTAHVNNVRPAVDTTVNTVAQNYGPKILVCILTGMGNDGLIGAKQVKQTGGGVMIQDRESCTVFGMPAAVFEAGIYDFMGNLTELAGMLTNCLNKSADKQLAA